MAGDVFYVDNRATGANNGSENNGAVDSNGVVIDAWQSIADITGVGNADFIHFGEGSGPYFEQFTATNNGTWYGNGVEINGGINANTVGAWVESSTAGEWYLDTPLSVEPLCGTVGGHFQLESADDADRQRGTPSSLTFDKQYGWGDADSLGASTLYVKSTVNPLLLEVWMAQEDYLINVAFNNNHYNDFIFSYVNNYFADCEATYEFNRCVFKYANNTGVLIATGKSCTLDSCNSYWCGHRFWKIDGAGSSLDVYNCVVYESHLVGIVGATTDGTSAATLINNIQIGGEAAALDVASATAVLTENNNCWYPRMSITSGTLDYLSKGNWTITDATDIPSARDTSTGDQETLTDPGFDISDDEYRASDFELARNSVCVGAGADLTATRETSNHTWLGMNGQPFANINPDMGSAQSTHFKQCPGNKT